SKNQPKDHSKNQPKNNMEKRAENFFQKIAKSRILLSHGICTLWYRAPEILLERPYNYKIDIWSIGVILLEMICLENKLTGANESDQIDKINDLPNIIETVWQKGVNSNNLRELVEKCLIYDASERITAENALKTRFFKKKVKRGSLSTSSR
ncbi:Cdc2-related protein kinase, partial [Pseudoloma neurophilia]